LKEGERERYTKREGDRLKERDKDRERYTKTERERDDEGKSIFFGEKFYKKTLDQKNVRLSFCSFKKFWAS